MTAAQQQRFVSLLTRDTLALILAGGRGARLRHLTRWRTKPAVHFGGKFRLIDFPLSNCVNSGIRRIGVLTQYKAHSLIHHLQQGWGFLRGHLGEFVEILPAQQRVGPSWYAGTADAVYQNLDIIRRHRPRYLLVLAGDHAYKMDYGRMLAFHVEENAEVTIGCIAVPRQDATSLGVMTVDEAQRVVRFAEKPSDPEPIPGEPDRALASMGIYVFEPEFLYERLKADAGRKDSSHDFGKDIIPTVIGEHRASAYRFVDPDTKEQGYWRDVGTIDAYWRANLELIGAEPVLDLYDRRWPIWTFEPQLPPARFVYDEEGHRGMAVESLVAGGCIIAGAVVRRSVLFAGVQVGSHSTVTDAVLLPDVAVGRRCRVSKAVLDRGSRIPDDMVIGEELTRDADRFFVTEEGVVVVTPEMLGQDFYAPASQPLHQA